MEPKKQTRVTILIADTQTSNQNYTKETEGHFILINGTIHQEEITIVNINVPKKNRKINSKNVYGNIKDPE
jgi:UDP-2,3-diacylglucosamine pyrophosphatase LpxH